MTDQIKTIALLRKTKASYRLIESETGITKDQLTRLANDRFLHPPEQLIDCLYNYLMREEKHRLRQRRGCKK